MLRVGAPLLAGTLLALALGIAALQPSDVSASHTSRLASAPSAPPVVHPARALPSVSGAEPPAFPMSSLNREAPAERLREVSAFVDGVVATTDVAEWRAKAWSPRLLPPRTLADLR